MILDPAVVPIFTFKKRIIIEVIKFLFLTITLGV